MEKKINKSAVCISFIIVTLILCAGYEGFLLNSVLKQKKELSGQLDEALKQKRCLEKEFAKARLYFTAKLKERDDKLSEKDVLINELINSNSVLIGRLLEVENKLAALIIANDFLEKQSERLEKQGLAAVGQSTDQEEAKGSKAKEIKKKVKVISAPQESKK